MAYTLPNFPMGNQLKEVTTDGFPPENADFDCVPESFAKAIQYYTGVYVSGDELKDAEYGESYANSGTALWRYVDDATDRARAKYGCTATPYNNSDTALLVSRIRTLVDAGFPVIATIPSAWGIAHDEATLANPNFSTHVICFYSEENGYLTAMNPWGGFAQRQPDSWWEGRLCYGQVWQVIQENAMTLDLTQVSGFFKADPTVVGQWLCTNGKTIHGGILTYYRSYGGRNLCGMSFLGLPLTNELQPDATYGGKVQIFERGSVAYDPVRKWDNPPGTPATDACYVMHIDTGVVNTWLLAALNAQLKAANASLASVKVQLVSAQNQEASDELTIKSLTDQVTTLSATVSSLQSEVAQLQQNPPPPDAQTAIDLIIADLKAAGKL